MDLRQVGMSSSELNRFHRAYTQSHGAVLVTGPTGSGKSTTLYAALGEAATPDHHIVTIEDPVEYSSRHHADPGQSQGGPHVRDGAAAIVPRRPGRDHGRRDPRPRDGADRDRGRPHRHLVLSTLHTNDAAGSITRLIEMGIEPFLVPRRSTAWSRSASCACSARSASATCCCPRRRCESTATAPASTSRAMSRSAASTATARVTAAAPGSTR